MSDLMTAWISASEDNAKALAQETLILEASESILEAMERKDINKAQLALALGKTKSYVTQLLHGSRNMTLRTFADIAFALDMRPAITLKPLFASQGWEELSEFTCVRIRHQQIAANEPADLIADEWQTISASLKVAA